MKLLSGETKFLLVIFIIGQIFGIVLNFYRILSEYDTAMHFIGGCLVASILATYLIERLGKFSYAINVLVTLGVGAAWEIAEFLADRVTSLDLQGSLEDTMIDQIVVLSAAIVINLIYFLKYKK